MENPRLVLNLLTLTMGEFILHLLFIGIRMVKKQKKCLALHRCLCHLLAMYLKYNLYHFIQCFPWWTPENKLPLVIT